MCYNQMKQVLGYYIDSIVMFVARRIIEHIRLVIFTMFYVVVVVTRGLLQMSIL